MLDRYRLARAEFYNHAPVLFMNIENIHAMRDSIKKLFDLVKREVYSRSDVAPGTRHWLSALEVRFEAHRALKKRCHFDPGCYVLCVVVFFTVLCVHFVFDLCVFQAFLRLYGLYIYVYVCMYLVFSSRLPRFDRFVYSSNSSSLCAVRATQSDLAQIQHYSIDKYI